MTHSPARTMISSAAIVSLACFSPWPADAVAGQPGLRRIALTGQQAPGTEPGVTFFNSIEDDIGVPPRLDDAGNVAFAPFLAGSAAGINDQGIWLEQDGSLTLVMRNGDPAPSTPPGVVFLTTGLAPISPRVAAGRVAFRAILAGPGVDPFTNAAGIWSGLPGELALVARRGDQAPGLPEGITLGIGQPLFNVQGHTLFGSFLAGPGVNIDNDESVWSDRTGSLQLVVREGTAAPGTNGVFGAANSLFAPGGLRAFNFNSQSRLALYGNLTGAGIDDFNDEGIWVEDEAGSLTLLVRENDPAPGIAPGVLFGAGNGIDVFAGPLINANGTVLFNSDLENLPPGSIPDFGPLGLESVWTNRGGGLAPIAFPGQQAPGQPDGVPFVGVGETALSDADRVAFVGILVPPPGPGGDFEDFGIWWDIPGPLTMLLRDGTQVPSLESGVVFGTTSPSNALAYDLLGRPSSNGKLGFTAFLTGPGITGLNNFGLFVAEATSDIDLIIRTGDEIDVASPGESPDLRVVADLLPGNMNDSGDVVFKVLFDDGAIGIFTTDPGLTGDLDGDGTVGIIDFLLLLANWGPCPLCDDCAADFDGDCAVGVVDLLTLLANWS